MRIKLHTPFVVECNGTDRRYDFVSHTLAEHLTIPAGTEFYRKGDLFISTCGKWTARLSTANFMLLHHAKLVEPRRSWAGWISGLFCR